MSSNSIRVEALFFDLARQQGQLMSRSAAQQVEHWARLGAALEATGLSVAAVADMLRAEPGASAAAAGHQVAEKELWAYKRAKQAQDLERVRSGKVTNDQMSWFSGGRAKAARLVDSPY